LSETSRRTLGHRKSSIAATVASGSMRTTLLAYSFSAAAAPGPRCKRSLKGCVSALIPLLLPSPLALSLMTSGKRSTMLSTCCSLTTSCCMPLPVTCGGTAGGGALEGLLVSGRGGASPRKTWQKARSRKARRLAPPSLAPPSASGGLGVVR